MFFALAVGFTVPRLWPWGWAFVLAWPLLTVPLGMYLAPTLVAGIGERGDWTLGAFAQNYVSAVLTFAIALVVGRLLRRLLDRLRRPRP